jgi:hypothetical protein
MITTNPSSYGPTDPVARPVGEAPGAGSTRPDDAVATALRWLLRGRDARIPLGDTPDAIRARLEQMRGEDILEFDHGVYRASEVALYSSYQLPSQLPSPFPAAPPGTDKRMRQITAIG